MSKIHDTYGKELFKDVKNFSSDYLQCKISYGNYGRGARIDGVIENKVAIEIESRVNKQIRGAIMDLIMHPYQKKLLILIPAHIGNEENAQNQSEFLLSHFIENKDNFKVITLKGNGKIKKEEIDKQKIKEALLFLGINNLD